MMYGEWNYKLQYLVNRTIIFKCHEFLRIPKWIYPMDLVLNQNFDGRIQILATNLFHCSVSTLQPSGKGHDSHPFAPWRSGSKRLKIVRRPSSRASKSGVLRGRPGGRAVILPDLFLAPKTAPCSHTLNIALSRSRRDANLLGIRLRAAICWGLGEMIGRKNPHL